MFFSLSPRSSSRIFFLISFPAFPVVFRHSLHSDAPFTLVCHLPLFAYVQTKFNSLFLSFYSFRHGNILYISSFLKIIPLYIRHIPKQSYFKGIHIFLFFLFALIFVCGQVDAHFSKTVVITILNILIFISSNVSLLFIDVFLGCYKLFLLLSSVLLCSSQCFPTDVTIAPRCLHSVTLPP